MTGNSLINLGELSKPATVLVEKISGAIGVLYEPRRIRSIAKAEADAQCIRAVAEIEVSELQRRAVQRWLAEEAKKQDNIETITSKALPNVEADAAPERIEADWIINFFDKARLISNEEMQVLWSKVLSGEANCPGTYSKRTVNYLASLDAEDAKLFTALCGFCWNPGYLLPLVLEVGDPVYTAVGIDFTSLGHLDDIGLIRFETSGGLTISDLESDFTLSYFAQKIEIRFEYVPNSLPVGHVVLSKVGAELAPLCGATPVPGFLSYVLGEWMSNGVMPASPYPRKIFRKRRRAAHA